MNGYKGPVNFVRVAGELRVRMRGVGVVEEREERVRRERGRGVWFGWPVMPDRSNVMAYVVKSVSEGGS